MRATILLILALGALLLILAACGSGGGSDTSDGGKPVPPPGSPAALIQASCTRCHPMAKVCLRVGQFNADVWAQTISRMIEHGATLDPGQIAPLAAFLAVRGEEIRPYCKE